MPGQTINGRQIASDKRAALREEVETIRQEHPGFTPCVAIFQIGIDAGGAMYITVVQQAATNCHIIVRSVNLSADILIAQVQTKIDMLNNDPAVHGIIVMNPVDSRTGITFDEVIQFIRPEKDVEGMRYENIGMLSHGVEGRIIPCAAKAMMTLIQHTGRQIEGSKVLVLGHRVTKGAPIAQLMIREKAIVTVCTTPNPDLVESLVGEADILVATMGNPNMVQGSWIRQGTVVIDAGFNYIDGVQVGDVEHNADTMERVSWITPVTGGVGPMIVAMLLTNTLQLARNQNQMVAN